MKNLTILFSALLICCQMQLSAQPCLPEGITFSTQAQIDNFQSNYPDCPEIEGWVFIGGYDITNLNGLSVLTSIGGDLSIDNNDALTSLTGLENVTSIGGDLFIDENHSLTSLMGLGNLTTIVGSLSIGYYQYYWGNNGNDALISLSGLDNLTSIGGYLRISGNDALASLTGLDNLGAGSISDLSIYNNCSLSACEVASICDYLSAPGGIVSIYNNADGCNNPGEIAIHCGFALPCLPFGNYYFSSQSEIDNFQTNYPGCTEIEGDVVISGDDITDLTGLNVLTAIGGDFSIYGNNSLTSLVGLENITAIWGDTYIGRSNGMGYVGNPSLLNLAGLEGLSSIGGYLWIVNNPSLSSLTGLGNLTTIGGLILEENYSLTNINGLNNVISIGGMLAIGYTDDLPDLTGLENLTSIGGRLYIFDNDALTSLTGTESLVSIGGGLQIIRNNALTSLTGLENLISLDGDLEIGGQFSSRGNLALADISSLKNLDAASIDNLDISYNTSLSACDVQSICDYLASPIGTIEIHDNAPGCNNFDEVWDACWSSVDEISAGGKFTISPNPLQSNTLIKYTLPNNSPVSLKILDLSGREMVMLVNEFQQQGEQKVVFNTMGLKPGIYFCVLKTDLGIQTKKIIKLN